MKKIQYSVSMLANMMNENEPKRAYASLQQTGQISLNELAEHMNAHNTLFSRGIIVGILIEMATCCRELLLQGYSIELGELGVIYPVIRSKGAESADKFTVEHITSYRAVFRKGKALQNLRQDAKFERTITRKAQAATLKAQMEGNTSADWSNINDDDENEG